LLGAGKLNCDIAWVPTVPPAGPDAEAEPIELGNVALD
jgi:hypothetical protein